MPKVSVIIPVYNVEQYIERCARSLFEQTLDDIEYIFVNDCTKDSSIAILKDIIKDYPERSSRITIIEHKENMGLPAARKSGITVSSGEYIANCDSDDWVDATIYEKMWEKATEEHLDMVVCGYSITDGSRIISTDLNEYKGFKSIKHAVIADHIPNFTWNKLIRRDLFNRIKKWPEYNLLEDTAIIAPIAYHCESIGKIDEPLYFYYRNDASICRNTKGRNKAEQIIANTNIAIEHIRDYGGEKDYRKELKHRKCVVKILNFDFRWQDYIMAFPEVTFSLLFDTHLPISKKMGHITKCLGIHGISKIVRKKCRK